jgi:hypothetical protein
MDLPSWAYTAAWIFWIGVFAAWEILALRDKDEGDTLTEHIRRWFHLRDTVQVRNYGRGILFIGLVWLLGHFW